MKKLLLIFITILFSIIPIVSSAENYACAYLYSGQANVLSLERVGNHFIIDWGGKWTIVFEDKKALVLSLTFSELPPPSSFTILIDKEKLNFVNVGIEFGNSTDIIEGECTITN
jgi:hypothetical protein|tara:strand:+ start:504 stop:845 length:342 start_codon:yes stop_codon:yes gene_type:complete